MGFEDKGQGLLVRSPARLRCGCRVTRRIEIGIVVLDTLVYDSNKRVDVMRLNKEGATRVVLSALVQTKTPASAIGVIGRACLG